MPAFFKSSWTEKAERIKKTLQEVKRDTLFSEPVCCYHCKELITNLKTHECFKQAKRVYINTCECCSAKTVSDWTKSHRLYCGKDCQFKTTALRVMETVAKRKKIDVRILVNCVWCGSGFKVFPYRLKETSELCCSPQCSGKHKQQKWLDKPQDEKKTFSEKMSLVFKRVSEKGRKCIQRSQPNSIERITGFISYCGLTYTGNRSYRVKFLDGTLKYPDFVLNDPQQSRKVVEVAGNYWHTKEEMDKVVLKYCEIGYDCLVIWEDELKRAPYQVAQKLLNFTHTLTIGIFKIVKGLPDPKQAYEFDSGFDIYSTKTIIIPPKEHRNVDCGVALLLPNFIECQIRGRSGFAKKGILCHFGTVDSEFRGEIGPILFNTTDQPFEIKAGSRVAQIIISPKFSPPVPFEKIRLVEVQNFENTARGDKGFGSTGVETN